MKITFLEAAVPLTKSFSKRGNSLIKTPYPFVWEFTSHDEEFTTLPQLEALLRKHASRGNCAIKGQLSRPLVKESRAGTTNSSDPTEWLVLDIDGLPESVAMSFIGDVATKQVQLTLERFLDFLGLGDVSYIVQWSASYGIENKKLRAHVFILLDKPYSAPTLKQWLIQKNFEVPLLRANMALTKTGNSLLWPLDISACQNDKLIYIAPPTLTGIKDPLGRMPRIQYISKDTEVFSLPANLNTSVQNRALMHKRIDELREQAGLPSRKYRYKVAGDHEVLMQPDEAIITEMKSERGFVYFNLNGGDSWAYYHPVNNPEYILNFKGEPAYLTKELLPSYWQDLQKAGNTYQPDVDGLIYLAFCDRKSSQYWRGTYSPATNELDIHAARTETQVRHFAKQHGVMLGDFIPEWDLVFDPTSNVRVDVANQIVNQYSPTQIMSNVGKPPKDVPPTCHKVIHHVLGGDDAIYSHFINWLATIVQTQTQTRTAWVLHGTEGTGKGLLINSILEPIFGHYTKKISLSELDSNYNTYMENALFINADEIQISALRDSRKLSAKLRGFITEPVINIRRMYSNEYPTDNRTNWIFSSNMPDPITLNRGDRRYNIGKYQDKKIEVTKDEVKKLADELQAFFNYLAAYKADHDAAGEIIETDDRAAMIGATESSLDAVGFAFLGGDMEYFISNLPTTADYKRSALTMNQVTRYAQTLGAIINRTNPKNGQCHVSRDELHNLFDYCVGDMVMSPGKFTKVLAHRRIHIEPLRIDGTTARGATTLWRDRKKFPSYLKQLAAL